MPTEHLPPTEQPPLTRDDVEERLARGEQLENVNIADLDLAGLELRGKRFRGSDVWGLQLYRGDGGPETEVRTDISETDWTDAAFASIGEETFFGRVDAERAVFGFSESLSSRRARHAAAGEKPTDRDSGGYHNFNGAEGNFRSTRWLHIDFAGDTGYDARFEGATLDDATFVACDLSAIDLSTTTFDRIAIRDCAMRGMQITAAQVPAVFEGIVIEGQMLTDLHSYDAARDPAAMREALERSYGIQVID